MHQFYADFFHRLEELHQDMYRALDGLPSEALDWIPGAEMNSLCILAAHTAGAERYWIGDVVAQDNSNRHRPDEFVAQGKSAAELQQTLADVLTHSRGVLETLTLDDLTRACVPPNHPERTFTVGWSLAHALEHTAVHVGHMQIIRQLWEQKEA
ncbi:MAG: DinB family protein [Anaerolineales bacterium]|nr:DinB family protein [Anaerolineales bacterium]